MKRQPHEWPEWTESQDDQVRQHAHLGAAAIAALIGRTAVAVASRASTLSIPLGRRHPEAVKRRYDPAAIREKISARVEFDTNGGCWLWVGNSADGRGSIMIGHLRREMAHRASYIVHRGPIPERLLVCHKCDIPACVNPEHLFLRTHHDNTQDMMAKGRGHFCKPDAVAAVRALAMAADRHVARGESHFRAQLTAEQVRAIFARRYTDKPKAVADEYGVSNVTVQLIFSGRTWKSVTGASANNDEASAGHPAASPAPASWGAF